MPVTGQAVLVLPSAPPTAALYGVSGVLAALARAAGPTLAGLLYAQVALSAPMIGAGLLTLLVGMALAISATRRLAAAAQVSARAGP